MSHNIKAGVATGESVQAIFSYAKEKGFEVQVVSGDKDLLQLVDDKVKVLTPAMGFAKEVADCMIFMDEGKIVEDCTKDNFFNNQTSLSVRAKEFLSKILR